MNVYVCNPKFSVNTYTHTHLLFTSTLLLSMAASTSIPKSSTNKYTHTHNTLTLYIDFCLVDGRKHKHTEVSASENYIRVTSKLENVPVA